MEDNSFCLYRHIRPDLDVPFYVGIGKPKRPFSKHDRNPFWYNIINKNNGQYKVDIIMENLSLEKAYEKEKEFIKLYGRKDLGTGSLVNLTDGGEGVYNVSIDTIKKMSAAKIGIPVKESVKNKISNSLKGKYTGKNHSSYGKIYTKEEKLRRSLGAKKYYSKNKSSNLKSVLQFNRNGELIKEWCGLIVAAKNFGITSAAISRVCRGIRPTAGGFIWKYNEE